MQSKARHIQATLGQLAVAGADAGRIADTAVSAWGDIDSALSPIIGQRGVAALYKRSLHLTLTDYPWLAAVYDDALEPGDVAPLRAALSQQSSSNAAAALGALLQTFHDLLGNLIGEPLTERLLRSVWDNSSSARAAQDISP